jgi:hypothetical protein
MSVAAVQNKSVNIDHFTNLLQCPVELDYLKTAVTLVPCSHKVNETIARAMYGGMQNNACLTKDRLCPECNQIVIAYHPDHKIRSIVALVLQNQTASNAAAVIQEGQSLPYPGKGAKFVVDRDWKTSYSAKESSVKIALKSLSEDSLILAVYILECKSGSIEIQMKIGQCNRQVLEQYFRQNALEFSQVEIGRCNPNKLEKYFKQNFTYIMHENWFRTTSPKMNRDLFKIIAENNEIPEEYLQMLRPVIEKGTWK